jgi:hypothetical protein
MRKKGKDSARGFGDTCDKGIIERLLCWLKDRVLVGFLLLIAVGG